MKEIKTQGENKGGSKRQGDHIMVDEERRRKLTMENMREDEKMRSCDEAWKCEVDDSRRNKGESKRDKRGRAKIVKEIRKRG